MHRLKGGSNKSVCVCVGVGGGGGGGGRGMGVGEAGGRRIKNKKRPIFVIFI